ncbi:hypothetical protein BaRGS_00008902 [Batillaria attramentaria]|uniref:C2H2-type domain-containing protein n=1 Tax=Batillaria attramentaria TaxID=370345 RepID=A0ABD0LJX1_9CAEN
MGANGKDFPRCCWSGQTSNGSDFTMEVFHGDLNHGGPSFDYRPVRMKRGEHGPFRRQHGCYDVIQEIDGQEVRHCNWVRFVKASNNPDEVNVISSKVKGHPFFQVIKHIKPNDELVVLFHSEKTEATPSDSVTQTMTSSREVKDSEACVSSNTDAKDSDACEDMSEAEKKHFSDTEEDQRNSSKDDDSSERLSNSDLQRSEGELHHSTESDQSSPRENRVTSSEVPETLPCPVTSTRVLAPEPPPKLPLEGHPVRRSQVRQTLLTEETHPNTHSSNLYYHRMTHNKEKPHKCDLCAKSFPTPGDLRSHMYVHSGSWPFRCHVCNRGFSKQTNLKNHLMLHSGDKPHECTKCGKRFALQCNLKTHLKTHEADSQTSCSKCGVVFSDKVTKMADGTCQQCSDESHHVTRPQEQKMKPQPSNFSISKLTDASPGANSNKNAKSPEDFQGVSPAQMASPYGQLYGHRPWFMTATGSPILGSTSSPSMVTTSPPGMTYVMKDMASLQPYGLFGGKTSTPVSGFFSPDVLARGAFMPAAHAPSPYHVTPTTPVGGWKQHVIAQGF